MCFDDCACMKVLMRKKHKETILNGKVVGLRQRLCRSMKNAFTSTVKLKLATPPNNDHLSITTTISESRSPYLENKEQRTSEQRPPVNNGHFLGPKCGRCTQI